MEADWTSALEPLGILEWLGKTARLSRRKARLFACACVRRLWRLLPDERSRQAVETGERFADGLASRRELVQAARAAIAAVEGPFADGERRAGACLHAAMAAWW